MTGDILTHVSTLRQSFDNEQKAPPSEGTALRGGYTLGLLSDTSSGVSKADLIIEVSH